jgi:hypothetical protein
MYEEINRIIEDYRAVDNTDYAIVLNGEWGCGKTYYVEHVLREAVEASKGRILYASLHGAKDYDQVVTQLMLSNIAVALGCKFDDLRDEYWLGKITQIFKGLDLSKFQLAGLDIKNFVSKIAKRIKNVSCKIDKSTTLVVIDDIERAINDETRRQILGTLYEDYIRRGYHVLLIGDETKINPESAYFECKEKYVRRTINVNVWQSDLVFDYAKSRCCRFDWLYETIEKQFKKFVESKKVVNLRVVAMMIDSVVDILSKLEGDFSKNYANFIFSATVPLVHAFSRGIIRPEDIEDFACLTKLQDILYFYSDKSKRSNLDDRMLKACSFFDEYCSDAGADFLLIKSVFRYVLTGYLDCKSVQAEILDLFEKKDLPESVAFRKLGSFWTSEESEIVESIREVMEFLKAGKYSFEEILSIYKGFSEIRNKKYISAWPYGDDIQGMFLNYIRLRSKVEKLPPRDEIVRIQMHRNLSSAVPGISRLYDEIDAFYNNLKLKADKDRIDNMFVALIKRDSIAASDILNGASGQWKIFTDIVKFGKIKEIVALPVMGIKFLEVQARSNILEITNSADFERDQIPDINKIVSYLEDYVKTGKDSVSRKERISELASVLKSSVKHMEDYLATHSVRNAL